ncbi:ribosome quality control complex subunit TCF25 [Anabrus simplex]|uniref:ribosome quality control complex subunit TCF25 n=1 Tax=Anabrus simplex TaxID=316456 RepID=UPI0035A372B7
MSSRVLRKLQGDTDFVNDNQDEGNSDIEPNLSDSRGARKKLHVNRYDLLNQHSHSESEVKEDDDHETEAVNIEDGSKEERDAVRRKKKKRKKKKAGKSNANNQRSSDDNLEVGQENVDHLLAVEKDDALIDHLVLHSHVYTNGSDRPGGRPLLSIKHKNLNPNNELRRIFGSKIIQTEQSKRRGRGRAYVKSTWLVSPKENWPHVGKTGISMRMEKKDCVQYFCYEHSANYQQVEKKFLEAVDSLNPDNIVMLINSNPYHVDALIQLSDLCKMSEDLQMAAELNERALYCLECAFHPLFSMAKGNCRLDYRRQENRALFIALFKHLTFVGQRACYRTALELCKLLLSLDFEGDPLAVILCIDFYALRSRKYAWLVTVAEEWESSKNLSQLPNFAFSHALAHFHVVGGGEFGELTMADKLLQSALIMFPGVLTLLLDKCSILIDPRVASHDFFGVRAQTSQSPALSQLVQLYVCRTYHEWKDPDVLPWLERNVHRVLDRVDSGERYIKDCEEKRRKRYQATPRNVLRHIILSDIKEVTGTIPSDVGPIMSFDPLPPLDSVNIYTRPQRPRMYQHSNALSMFFRSLLPNFNPNEPAGPDFDIQLMDDAGGDADAAAGAVASAGANLRDSVTMLMDAIGHVLANIPVREFDVVVDDTDDEQNRPET